VTGEFIVGDEFCKQTWAKGLDANGRPIRLPDSDPSPNGTLVYPGLEGAVNWPAPSYSPLTGLYYVHGQDNYAQVFYKMKPEYQAGRNYEGGGTRNLLGAEPHGVVKAIDAATAKLKWEFREQSSSNGAILTTATGLLFTGTRDGYFYSLDARDGKLLYRFQTGGSIHGGTVSYLVDGKQYLAVAAGAGLFVFGL
jgi:alcohol dehydrogenase (cytochrome c)